MKGEVLEDPGAQIIDLLHGRSWNIRVRVRNRFGVSHRRRVHRGLPGNERKWIEVSTEASYGVIDVNLGEKWFLFVRVGNEPPGLIMSASNRIAGDMVHRFEHKDRAVGELLPGNDFDRSREGSARNGFNTSIWPRSS